MKIAVLSCFYPFRGGISQFNAALLTELSGENDVRAFNFKRQYPEILFPGKTQYVTADDEAAVIDSTAVLDTVNPFSYVRTAREILEWSPDLVIVRYWMSWFAPSLGYVTRYLKRRGVKVISILDNVIPHERHFFDTPLTKYFLGGSSGCITLCDAVASELKDINAHIPCKVISHPLYTHFGEKLSREEALTTLGLKPERRTLLFFGLIRHYKGLDILLDAFAGLQDTYQLIIAGEPYGDFNPYLEKIDAIGHDRIALCTEYIRDSRVKDFFSGADLCVLPYRSATQSGVSAVSFHFEVPMLVTDVGGLKESVYDTGAGLLCRECSAEAVREGIEYYFSDPQIKESCIKGIKTLKEKLSWKNFCRELIDFYKVIS